MIEPGVVISDRYRILRVIGEGGMGTVFEAEHTGVGRKVAVKVLNSDVAGMPAVVERFQFEARSAAAIGHDNIIDVIDFGEHEGAPFMVMEFLKGESLTDRLSRVRRLPVGHAAYILNQVLSALAAAHQAGIVHRDLKPDNVFLLQKANNPDFVKLLDFGIAKLRTDDSGVELKARHATQTGVVLGTPHYMSPEQALALRDLDHRIDIYAAGVMLYEMTTGDIPFDAESDAELLMEIAYQVHGVKPPSTRLPGLEPVDPIVLRAMSKSRDARYADAASFAAALTPLIEVPTNISIADRSARRIALSVASPIPAETIQRVSDVTRIDGSPATLAPPPMEPGVQPPRTARRMAVGIAIGAGIVAVVGTAGVVTSRAHSTPAIVAPARITAAAITGSSARDTNVQIDLEQLPDDATVLLDDHTEAGRHLSLVRGTSHTIRVRASGHDDYVTTLVADRDRSFVIALVRSVPTPPAVARAVISENTPQPAQRPSTAPAGRAPRATPAPATAAAVPREAAHTNRVANPLPVSTEF